MRTRDGNPDARRDKRRDGNNFHSLTLVGTCQELELKSLSVTGYRTQISSRSNRNAILKQLD